MGFTHCTNNKGTHDKIAGSQLQEMEVGRRRWKDVLSQIDPSTLEEPGVEGIWSIKQIVAHILGSCLPH